jgi:hypothetical protein
MRRNRAEKSGKSNREGVKWSHRAIFFACRHQIRIHSTYPSIRAIDSFEEAAAFAEQNESRRGAEECLQSGQMQFKRAGEPAPCATST